MQQKKVSELSILKGKTAVVTGSTSGIGLRCARAFAGAGAHIVLNGIGAPADVEKTRTAIENDASPFRSAYVAAREQDVLNHPILAHVACLHRFRVNQGRASMAVADPPLPRLGFRTPTCDCFQLFCDARPSIRETATVSVCNRLAILRDAGRIGPVLPI